MRSPRAPLASPHGGRRRRPPSPNFLETKGGTNSELKARSPRPPWATRTLRRPLGLGYAVSQVTWEDSARNPSLPTDFGAHYVSHVTREDFCQKLHDHRRFRPHCVSHRVPPKSGLRWHQRSLGLRRRLGRTSDHTVLEPRAPFLATFSVSPRLARATMPLALTAGSTAHLLTTTSPWMWPEPDPTETTRSLL